MMISNFTITTNGKAYRVLEQAPGDSTASLLRYNNSTKGDSPIEFGSLEEASDFVEGLKEVQKEIEEEKVWTEVTPKVVLRLSLRLEVNASFWADILDEAERKVGGSCMLPGGSVSYELKSSSAGFERDPAVKQVLQSYFNLDVSDLKAITVAKEGK